MKSKDYKPSNAYERARKRVNDIKGFYGHLAIYIIVNAIVLFTNGRFLFTIIGERAFEDSVFADWVDWNTYGTPILWGFALAIHGISVYGKNPILGKKWEERQIEKYMNKDNGKL